MSKRGVIVSDEEIEKETNFDGEVTGITFSSLRSQSHLDVSVWVREELGGRTDPQGKTLRGAFYP